MYRPYVWAVQALTATLYSTLLLKVTCENSTTTMVKAARLQHGTVIISMTEY